MAEDAMSTTSNCQLVGLQDYEIRDWTQSFGCTEEELRRAVAEVGVSADDVKSWLGR
ncbi:MAG: DUF3606 domain-containing protein [Comamonadaceae bacterium]|nr:MAG: DUF3606 domain-containing protein [Comamonadaceae bacterium]